MNKFIYIILITLLSMGFFANWVISKAESSIEIPIIKEVPSFSFTNQNGEKFSNDNFRGKVTILNFIFTSCTGPCPLMTSNMQKLYSNFKGTKEIQFVSITVDPEIDTQEKLKSEAEMIGVDNNQWQFLRSDLDEVKKLKRDGFMLFADNLPNGHSIKSILIDNVGNIRKYYDGTDIGSQEILKKDIVYLLDNMSI
tara:strand:- start:3556 stop:4143 length:588 start_codon:yes stop_codon:yes gene_type:complete